MRWNWNTIIKAISLMYSITSNSWDYHKSRSPRWRRTEYGYKPTFDCDRDLSQHNHCKDTTYGRGYNYLSTPIHKLLDTFQPRYSIYTYLLQLQFLPAKKIPLQAWWKCGTVKLTGYHLVQHGRGNCKCAHFLDRCFLMFSIIQKNKKKKKNAFTVRSSCYGMNYKLLNEV